ncbi:hypothetical protein JOQ06_006984, partial [Pogonophryne albipinna]
MPAADALWSLCCSRCPRACRSLPQVPRINRVRTLSLLFRKSVTRQRPAGRHCAESRGTPAARCHCSSMCRFVPEQRGSDGPGIRAASNRQERELLVSGMILIPSECSMVRGGPTLFGLTGLGSAEVTGTCGLGEDTKSFTVRPGSLPSSPQNRLRTTLTQEHMEAFMLMCTEKEILMALDTDGVIDRVAETSELLRHLLVILTAHALLLKPCLDLLPGTTQSSSACLLKSVSTV